MAAAARGGSAGHHLLAVVPLRRQYAPLSGTPVNPPGFVPDHLLALWLGYVAVLHAQAGGLHARRESFLILSLTATALLLVVVYLVGLPSFDKMVVGSSSPLSLPRSFVRLIGQGTFGATMFSWPRGARAAGQLAATALFLLSAASLVPVLLRRPAERPRALGLLAFQGAIVCLALGMSVGRPGFSADRYALLFAPGLCDLYFIWMLYGGARIGVSVIMALFLGQLVLALPEFRYGVSKGKYHKYRMAGFQRDLESGMPVYMLLGRYDRLLGAESTQLDDARRYRFGSFGSMQGDPEFREVSVPIEPVVVCDLEWQDGVFRPVGADPQLVFELPESRFLGGLELKYSHDGAQRGAPEPFRISCRQSGSERFSAARTRLSRFDCLGPGEETATVWIGARVKQFCIRPATERGSYALRISGITLLLPAQEDRFTAPPEDADVPRAPWQAESDTPEELMALDQFAQSWPVDLLHSPQLFTSDIQRAVRP
jgi:hypothetical protein